MMKLYGIPNCDTVKKARVWLTEHNFDYEWHDFKKNVLSPALIEYWVANCGWEVLVNRQGTTWRKLDEASKASVIDAASATALMLASPSVIKRPVLDYNGKIIVGFKPETYSSLLL
ncbi:ArsC family reductase [Deefgea piscis]|uniref:ArsC family reductase n=1 Tax=Deefgea piscis TaxID=2739061 RepID=UPI001C7F7C1B|nr:ArsC family reductase [Deefgea piscis]QZA82710.1 ArsC family reductase [Deefgea piscis]